MFQRLTGSNFPIFFPIVKSNIFRPNFAKIFSAEFCKFSRPNFATFLGRILQLFSTEFCNEFSRPNFLGRTFSAELSRPNFATVSRPNFATISWPNFMKFCVNCHVFKNLVETTIANFDADRQFCSCLPICFEENFK